jgi:protein-tyrosine phosphatase
MTRRILFVCLGNIGQSLTLDSAGTSNWHDGEPPCPQMVRAASSRGYDISQLRARQLQRADFDRFDLIIGMDAENIADIEALRPAGSRLPVRLFTDYAPETGMNHVPDAYFTHDYDGALTLIEACAHGLVRALEVG